ncbi:MAG: alpha/beta hydrolase [Deltaproteobacteria bacterium]|nr:alpha/beta hydrolase [Deltaproteobacteria bacterium]
MIGSIEQHVNFTSAYVDSRTVDIWLPPGYGDSDNRRYPVMYMHDGQNLFHSETSFIGVDWGMDETMARLIDKGSIEAAIVVGIWNTPNRVREYMPQRPVESPAGTTVLQQFAAEFDGKPLSDNYLKFIVRDVKSFVDNRYPTLPGPEHTFIMGSSMGALISLYALCEYPDVFSGTGCLSTHWPAVESVIIDYLESALPGPGRHKLYFDYGTETLDAPYESCQKSVDTVMQSVGYESGKDWKTLKFPGAEHSERAWRDRVHIPLQFLLGRGQPE